MTTVEKRHSSRKGRGHRKHSSGGLSDTSSGGSFLDDTDREVSSLTDRAFRSLCIGEEAVYNDSDLGSSPSALKERHQAFSQEIIVAPDSQVREKRDRDPVKGAAQRSFSLQRCGLGGGEAGWEREQEGRSWAGQYRVGTQGYSAWEGQGEGRVSATFQRSFTDVSQQEKSLREERLSFLSNGGSDPSWQQRRSRSRVSSLIKAFSSEGCSGGDGGVEGKLKEWNNECSWDKSALMSIQRELSEFSTAYNQNFPTGPFPTAGSFPQQTGPFPGSGNSLYPSEVSSTATASFLRSSHGKISSKHSMFTQLNSTSNFFLHSELSPFQPLWRDNNRFPFHQGYVAGFMTSADFPKWYDSPMYKEMTLEQQFHGFRGFTETGSRPQHKPLEAVAPPPQLRSTSTMLQKASAVEKHSDYESAGHCPPWKRAQSVGSNRYPSLRPSTISPTNERPRRGQDAVSSLNEFRRTEQVAKLTAEQSVTMLINSSAPRDAVDGIDNRATSFSNKVSTVAVQQAVVTSNTPFNITQLLTPVIHNQQDTESTPEGLQMAHNQPAIMGERERRGPTPEVRMASYKSRASGLLFNLKDNRKRVKSTYSPTKFTGMEVTGRSKSNLGGYGLRDTVVDNLDALDIVVPQLAGEREPSAVCQPQTNPQCDPSRQPTTAHHLQHLNYTDTSEAGAYQALRSSQTREEMVHHQEYRGNYHNSNLPTTHQNDPCELAIPSPAVIDSIQTSDVNRTTERYSKGSGYEQVRGKQYGSIDASSQESWKQHVSNTTYHGRETFGVNERVTDMRPWKGEIAALIEKDKQSLLSRTAATMKQEPKQNYDWNVVNGQDEMREPGKQYVPEGRVHSAAEVLTGRNSLPHKEVRPISDYTKNQNDWCRSAGQDNIKTSVNLESDRTYAVRNTFTERGQPVHAKPHGLWVEQNKRHQVYVNKEQYDQDVQWNSSYKNDNRQYSANASTSARWGKDHSENTDNTITMLHQTVGKYPRNEAFTANDLDGMHMKVLAKAEKANVKAEQMKAELPKAEHSKAEKAKSDLKNADKPKAELAKAEDTLALAKTENTKAELSKADIAKAQAVVAQTELAKAELAIAQAELAKAELAKAQAELAKAELVKAQADLAKAELAKAQAEEVKAEHTKTEQAEAELAKCKRAKEEKVKAELATAHLPKAELVQEKVAISKAELANAEKAKHFEQTEQAIIKPEKAKNDDPAKFTSWSNSEDRYGINDILTTRDYEQVKRERLGEKRYSVNDAVPTTVDKVSNEIISTQAEIKPPLQKDVAPISSYEQEDRGQDEYTGFREQNGFSHEVSAKENKHRSIEVAATDESKKIDSPATINHETAITTTGYTKDESISNQRLGTKVEEQVLGNQKENSERRSEGPWVYSESSKQFKLASQTESRRKPSDQSLPLSKEVHPSSFRPMSLKEKGQTKQQLLTSKLKAQAEKEISAIKEKGFGKQDGLLLRNPTKHLEQRERGQSGQESKIIKHYVSKGQTNNDLCINNATAQSQHKGKATIEESTVSDDQQSITSLKGTRNKSQVNDGTEKDMLQSTEVKSQNEYNSDEISCKMFSGKSESVSEDDSLQIMGIMVTITEPSQEKEDGFITQQKVKGNEKREDEAIQNKLPYNNSESDPTITPKADQAALSKSGVSSKRQDSAFADHVIPEKTRQQTQLSDGKAEIQTEHAARESKQVTLAPETTNSYPENTEKPPSNGSDQFQKEILVHDSSAVKDGRFAEVKQAKNKQLAETQPLFFKQGITESNNLTTTEIIGKGDSSFQDAPVENIHIGSIAVCVVAGTHQTDNQQNTESHSVAKHVVSGAEKPTGDSNVHIDSIAIRVVSGVTENENGKTTANEKANNSADPTGETSSFKPEVSSRQKQLPTVPTAIADYARLKVISTEEDSPSKTDSPSREDGYFPMIQTRRSRRPVFPPEQHEQPVAGVMLGKEVAAVKEPEVPYKLNTATKIGGVLSSMEQQQRKTGMFSLREKAKEAISLNKEGLTGTTDTDIFKHNNVPEHATGLENHPEYQSTQTAHEPGKQRFSPKVDATQYMEAMQVSLGNEYTMEKREEQSKVEERTKREKEDIKEVERTALQRNKERVAREDEEYQKEKERREQREEQKENELREQHKWREEKKKEERTEEERREVVRREQQQQQDLKREAEMKEENRIARLREEERKDKDRRERLREEEKNEEERKELQLQREEEQKEKRRARQREEEKMNALQYYSISSPENQARPRDRPLFSPQPSPHRGNPEDWEYHVRPHLHTSPAPPSTRSNTSSPALGGKPTMFRVKDNTFRSSSLTKSVKPRFHKSLGEEFRVGSPLWSGSERGDEVHERTRESGLEAHRECTGTPEYHESGISSHRQTRVRDTQHAVDHTALSEPTHTQPYSRPYSRRSVVLDDDDSRSMISNMSGDVESYAASVADMSERSSGLYDSEFTSRGCYNRPDSACSFASDVGRPMGKPPTVPPKSDKALRRAKRLTTRRIKKESKPETEVEADPVENPVHAVASVPSSPSELGSSNRPARASAHFSAPVSLPLAPSSISSVPFAPTDLRSSHRQSFYASPNAKAPTSLPHASPHPRVPGQVVSVSSSPTYQPIAHPRHLVSPLASPLTSPMNVPQYHVDPNYTSPSGLSLPQPFTQSLTQKKVLQDPGSGQYFVVDMPVQVKTKTFFDPETGKYVQLNVRQPGQGGSLSQAQPQGYPQSLPEASYIQPPTYPPYTQSKASPAGRPYVLYQGYPQNYQSLPVSSLSTHRSHSGMSVLETPTQDCQNPHPKEESQGWAGDGEGQGEAWSNQGYGGQEQTPYMDTAHDTHSRPGEGTVYGSDANSVPHRDIITMSELEDFAMDSGDWL
ncbi:uncharacterized protein LOC105027245 [Esox lucius]|uniref:uncharacterized protein LOC105027245 n=1 Tax=Esox lucius TaxID=8010 RepID=UPI0010BDF820|nr:uncharacterized protein LOC105027245 [Esox lucius]